MTVLAAHCPDARGAQQTFLPTQQEKDKDKDKDKRGASPDDKASSAKDNTDDPNAEELTAQEILGKRVIEASKDTVLLSTLVIVPDEASYLAALAGWRVDEKGRQTRYPVLIDDGGYAAEQRIARFVRAYKPTRVVRFNGKDPAFPGPDQREDRRTAIDTVLANIWGAAPGPGKPDEELRKRWGELKFIPQGVVVLWPTDPAWTAGLALAAAHGQPLVWVEPRGGSINGSIDIVKTNEISVAIAEACSRLGYAFDKLKDDIETITLCLDVPVKIAMPENDPRVFIALTDMIGRTIKTKNRIKVADRWAWASQITGDASDAAYCAMCALFLRWWDQAWLLDGYNCASPWVEFDMSIANKVFEKDGIKVILDDAVNGMGLEDLRRRSAGRRLGAVQAAGGASGMGVDATFVAINSKGKPDDIELIPGIAKPVDLPIMHRPSAIFLVHSWSANAPMERNTVAGMWHERGAYAYFGSVHEPRLRGFIPTPITVKRLLVKMPWSTAMYLDNTDPWKTACFGDALMTYGIEPQRAEDPVGLAGGLSDVADEMREALRARRFDRALRAMTFLGDDRRAAKLLGLLLRTNPTAVSADVALAGIGSAFVVGDFDTLMGAARATLPILNDPFRSESEKPLEVRDMVWHAVWNDNILSPEDARLLSLCLRPECLHRDTDEAIQEIKRVFPRAGTPDDVVARACALTKDAKEIDELKRLAR